MFHDAHAYHRLVKFTVIILACFFVSCENDESTIAKLTVSKREPSELIRNLQTLYSDSGIVKVKVTAPVLLRYIEPKPLTEMPKGIQIEFYDEHLKVISHLKAGYAIQDVQAHKWEAQRDVVVVNEKGNTLNTEKLIWDENSQLLSSDQFVKITTAEEIIYGNGFEANQDFSRYRIFNVKGRITVKK